MAIAIHGACPNESLEVILSFAIYLSVSWSFSKFGVECSLARREEQLGTAMDCLDVASLAKVQAFSAAVLEAGVAKAAGTQGEAAYHRLREAAASLDSQLVDRIFARMFARRLLAACWHVKPDACDVLPFLIDRPRRFDGELRVCGKAEADVIDIPTLPQRMNFLGAGLTRSSILLSRTLNSSLAFQMLQRPEPRTLNFKTGMMKIGTR